MDYVRQSLAEDETLVYVAHFHWFYTFNAILNGFFGFFLAALVIFAAIHIEPIIFRGTNFEAMAILERVRAVHPSAKAFSLLVFAIGLFRYAHMMVIKATTEIVVTNRRLVYKKGLVAREVGEMNIDRIEGINVIQGIMGRLLGYGRLVVRGMGIGELFLPPVENPLELRKAMERARTV